eukprot:761230-Hanusia_phi.AAC.3
MQRELLHASCCVVCAQLKVQMQIPRERVPESRACAHSRAQVRTRLEDEGRRMLPGIRNALGILDLSQQIRRRMQRKFPLLPPLCPSPTPTSKFDASLTSDKKK